MHKQGIWARWGKRLTMVVLAVLFVLSAGFNLLFQIDYTQGVSMDPTLKNEQMLVVWRPTAMNVLHVGYHRDDIVVAINRSHRVGLKQGELLVKRLVGLPRETVGITRKTVLINGQTLAEPYVTYPMDNSTYAYGGVNGGGSAFRTPGYTDTVHLAANQYYLLGDNRPQSADSRWFGPIHRSQLRGKVAWILGLYHDTAGQRWLTNGIRALPFFLLVALILVNATGHATVKPAAKQLTAGHAKRRRK